jgi:hypothetical protein
MPLAHLARLHKISRHVRQNTLTQWKAINALLAGHASVETEDHVFELAEQIAEEYCRVGPVYGVPPSPFLIQAAYGQTAKGISLRISSLRWELQRRDGRGGNLTNSRGGQQALSMMNGRLSRRFIERRESKLAEMKYGTGSVAGDASPAVTSVIPAAAPQTRRKSRKKIKRFEFEELAGGLWQEEVKKSPDVSKDALVCIADRLDESPFTPPLAYLEKSHRSEVACHNKKVGKEALTTWHDLASNPRFQGGMRRRLSHAAQERRRRLKRSAEGRTQLNCDGFKSSPQGPA